MLNNFSYSVIVDKYTSDEALLSAISELGNVIEPSTFWSTIANNPEYRPTHRRMCIFQLFMRHIHQGINLSNFAKILDKPVWIKRENITTVTHLRGKLPFKWSFDDTIFIIRPRLPQKNNSAIYLKIAEKEIDQDEFYDFLREKTNNQRYSEAIILEIGLSEINEKK